MQSTISTKNRIHWRKTIFLLDIIIMLLLYSVQLVYAGTNDNKSNWKVINIGMNEKAIDFAYNGSTYVVIGSGGKIYTSKDTINWRCNYLQVGDLGRVIWDGSQFCIYGDSIVFHSKDGLRWVNPTKENYNDNLVVSGYLYEFVNAWGGYFAVHEYGNIFSSLNQKDWTEVSVGSMVSIASNGNKVVAVGRGQIEYTDDGVNWKGLGIDEKYMLYSVVWNGSKFIAAGTNGAVFTSVYGDKWEEHDIDQNINIYSLFCKDETVIAAGKKGVILISKDGSSWEQSDTGINEDLIKVIKYGDNIITLSKKGKILICNNMKTHSMKQATVNIPSKIKWAKVKCQSLDEGDVLHDILWDGKKYIAVGSNASIYSSSDLIKWTKSNFSKEQENREQLNFISITYDGKKYEAIGIDDSYSMEEQDEPINTILLFGAVSDDGLNWESINSDLINSDGNEYVNASDGTMDSIATDGKITVAVSGRGRIFKLEDGNWELKKVFEHNIEKVVYIKDRFFAMSSDASDYFFLESVDGVNWIQDTSISKASIITVIWDGKRFIALDTDNTLYEGEE